jgi:transcriptional regulator with XRE-family HTH domain
MVSPKKRRDIHVGTHIRKLRRLQDLTQQNVADNCGFTKSLLSKIERGKVVPPMSTLVKIAGTLNTNIADLMTEGARVDSIFIPANQETKPAHTESGYEMLPLAMEFKQKRMQPFIITCRPEDLNDKPNSHGGEEFIFVLEGIMEFRVGEEIYTMRPRDGIFFNSIREHHIVKVITNQVVYLDIFN